MADAIKWLCLCVFPGTEMSLRVWNRFVVVTEVFGYLRLLDEVVVDKQSDPAFQQASLKLIAGHPKAKWLQCSRIGGPLATRTHTLMWREHTHKCIHSNCQFSNANRFKYVLSTFAFCLNSHLTLTFWFFFCCLPGFLPASWLPVSLLSMSTHLILNLSFGQVKEGRVMNRNRWIKAKWDDEGARWTLVHLSWG